MTGRRGPRVRLDPWAEGDLDLLRRINVPEMKRNLGGPETDEQVVARNRRYVAFGGSGTGQMFRVVLVSGEEPAGGIPGEEPAGGIPGEEPVGSVGYWDRVWRDEPVYEMGWSILPEYQGRGLASAAATAAVARARAERRHRSVHAFPSVTNPASNAVCRRVGFELLAEVDFEYPRGSWMRCNDWRLDLIGNDL